MMCVVGIPKSRKFLLDPPPFFARRVALTHRGIVGKDINGNKEKT
jgi:hypothetical protein